MYKAPQDHIIIVSAELYTPIYRLAQNYKYYCTCFSWIWLNERHSEGSNIGPDLHYFFTVVSLHPPQYPLKQFHNKMFPADKSHRYLWRLFTRAFPLCHSLTRHPSLCLRYNKMLLRMFLGHPLFFAVHCLLNCSIKPISHLRLSQCSNHQITAVKQFPSCDCFRSLHCPSESVDHE